MRRANRSTLRGDGATRFHRGDQPPGLRFQVVVLLGDVHVDRHPVGHNDEVGTPGGDVWRLFGITYASILAGPMPSIDRKTRTRLRLAYAATTRRAWVLAVLSAEGKLDSPISAG